MKGSSKRYSLEVVVLALADIIRRCSRAGGKDSQLMDVASLDPAKNWNIDGPLHSLSVSTKDVPTEENTTSNDS